MATGAYQPIVPYELEERRRGTLKGVEAATQSFKKGTPLIDSSGSLAAAAADPTSIKGLSCADATGTTGSVVEYYPLRAGAVYEATFVGTLALSDNYANYGLAKDATTGYWGVVPAETEDQVIVLGPAPGWAVGDVNPRILITFDAANIQGQ